MFLALLHILFSHMHGLFPALFTFFLWGRSLDSSWLMLSWELTEIDQKGMVGVAVEPLIRAFTGSKLMPSLAFTGSVSSWPVLVVPYLRRRHLQPVLRGIVAPALGG
jgi:hypothetical protein